MGRYDTDGSSALAPNDPYNDMDRADYRPNLRVINGGKSNNSASTSSASSSQLSTNTQNPSASAQSTLRDSEDSALSGERTFFTGQGRASQASTNKNRFSLKGKKKHFAIISIIVGILTGGAAFLGTTNSLLAPALENLMTEATDTQYASYTKRTAKIINYMLGKNNPTETTLSGKLKYGKMSKKFQKRLESQGITYEGKGKTAVLKFDGQEITASDFAKRFKDDVEFRDAFLKAKHGRVANFFDNMATKIFDHFGITRNLWRNYESDSDSQKSKSQFDDTMKEKFDGDETDTNVKQKTEVEETDKDGNVITDEKGNPVTKIEDETLGDANAKTNNTTADARTKAESFLNGTASKVADAGNIACTFLKLGSMISVAVAANEIYQSINYFMALMENPSKMMAGDGDNSAINETLNMLTTPVSGTFTDSSKLEITLDSVAKKLISSGEAKEETITGAPIEANGLQMMLAGAPALAQTNSRYSLESTISSIAKAMNMTNKQVIGCTITQTTGAIVSIAANVLTLGVATIAEMAWGLVKSAAISIGAELVLSFLIPKIAQVLFSNVFESVTGIPAGEMLARGGSATNTRLGRSGSAQSLSSESAALAYADVNQEVIAMEAEADRLNRSPFDISSKNTFLGSIAYKFLPLSLSVSNTTSTISSVSNLTHITSDSIASLTSSASAKTKKDSTYMTTFGDCPQLEGIGAVGDIYCNPVTTTDTELIDIEPDDDDYLNAIKDDLDCEDKDTCEIKENSELSKYIVYCANRDSPFGVIDANILGSLNIGENNEIASTAKTVAGWVPILGDVVDIVDAATESTNVEWANGKKCVNSEENGDWETFKYYQRFYEDQRILEQIGQYDDDGGKSPVTAFLEKYEDEHPVDNSAAGTLARIAGITKDDAEFVIALADYSQFLENYDPSTRLAMDGSASDYKTGDQVIAEIKDEHIYFESDDIVEPEPEAIIAQRYLIYPDVRNRSYITA